MATKKKTAPGHIHPVTSLKQAVVTLDAAMLVAISGAEKGPVHKLRTSTRRVEAQMRLLDLPGVVGSHVLPPNSKQVNAVSKRLRRVRRAAGKVRDLDVQLDTIEKDAPDEAAVHEGTPPDLVLQQADKLRKHLKHTRDIKAARLIAVLQHEEQLLAAALRALEQELKPTSAYAITATALGDHVRRWFTREVGQVLHVQARSISTGEAALSKGLEKLDEEALHALRKAAKQCRYMMENAPDNASAKQIAGQFEEVQEAGGLWHDWVLLAALSRGFHGRKAELTQRYEKHANAELANYRLRLAELLPRLMERIRS